jgi:hypothetical protein
MNLWGYAALPPPDELRAADADWGGHRRPGLSTRLARID